MLNISEDLTAISEKINEFWKKVGVTKLSVPPLAAHTILNYWRCRALEAESEITRMRMLTMREFEAETNKRNADSGQEEWRSRALSAEEIVDRLSRFHSTPHPDSK